jgi:hypothetical protein
MYLSRAQIEEIAVAVMKDFNDFFFNEKTGRKKNDLQGTPIDQFAKDYLGLSVSFARLSYDGNLCGLTAYADTEFVLEEGGVRRTILLKQNQVILDMSFIAPGQVRNLCGKRRFTLAHECAHQILYQMQSEEVKASCRKKYAAHTAYSLRDLKTKEDWNEWQANALGAAILMPQNQIDLAMWYFAKSNRLTNYGGYFNYKDRMVLANICQTFGVSKSAAIIRLKELGFMEERPYSDFRDPLEVWNEE